MDKYKEEKISGPPPSAPQRVATTTTLSWRQPHATDCTPLFHRHANSTIKQFLDFWWLAVHGAMCYQFTRSPQNAWQVFSARAACRFQVSQSERFFWPIVFVVVPSDCKKIFRQFRETGHNHFLLLLSNSSLTNSEITLLIWAVQEES
jgi:hypothetical protein